MKLFTAASAVLLAYLASTASGVELDPENEASIRSAARQYAYGLMSLYKGNATDLPIADVGIWPQPHYWWEGGAAWGGMIEYSQFTGDDSHVKALQQALTANYGPKNDFILSYRKSQTGNDDQAFWALAVMSALEYQFPDPEKAPVAYLEVAVNVFENIVGRWDTTSCGGGLKWQIYPENAYGYNYKNSISNGCAFALGARLARYTGEQKYADWAVKIYDWTNKVGLITSAFEVFDGTGDKANCAKVSDKTQWTYNNAMFLHGSAYMYDVTNGASVWKDRTAGFLKRAEIFFTPYKNATNVMYEWVCETGETGRRCNLDQQSFKAYLARFMAKTALMAPFTKDTITNYLKASAVGAAKSCSGGANGATCGSKWYQGSWDGTSGVGQQLSALEITQALLQVNKGILPVKKNAQRPAPSAVPVSSSASVVPSQAPSKPTQLSSSVAISSTPLHTPDAAVASRESTASSSYVKPSKVASSSSAGAVLNAIGQAKSECTSSVTKTVYVSAVSSNLVAPSAVDNSLSLAVPTIPLVSSTGISAKPPANSSSHTTTAGMPEFSSAASSVGAALGAMVVPAVAALVFGPL